MTKPMPVVVNWIDSNRLDGQHEPDDLPGLALIETIGWMIAEDPESVTVSREILTVRGEDDSVRGTICIPRCAVQSVRRLEFGPHFEESDDLYSADDLPGVAEHSPDVDSSNWGPHSCGR